MHKRPTPLGTALLDRRDWTLNYERGLVGLKHAGHLAYRPRLLGSMISRWPRKQESANRIFGRPRLACWCLACGCTSRSSDRLIRRAFIVGTLGVLFRFGGNFHARSIDVPGSPASSVAPLFLPVGGLTLRSGQGISVGLVPL